MRIVTTIGAAILAVCAAHAQPVQVDPPPVYAEPPRPAVKMRPKEIADFAKASRVVAARNLKDPGSAQFRGLFVSQGRTIVEGKVTYSIHLCGHINAKNSYGAYTGFTRFAANQYAAHLEDASSEAGATAFGQVIWDSLCSTRVADVK